MKNLIVFAIIFLATFSFAQAQCSDTVHGNVELENEVSNGKVTPQIKSFVSCELNQKVGLYGWFQTSKGFSQAYGGPTFSPNKNLQFGIAAGVKTGRKLVRVAGFVSAKKGKLANTVIVEGRDGTWYRDIASYKASKNLSLALVVESGKGAGARLDFTPHQKLSVGGEYFPTTRIFLFGGSYNF